MYIEPNTIIKLMRGCPLEANYEHTIWFPNIAKQREYFDSLIIPGGVLGKNSYQRHTRGVMRVQMPYGKLVGCNYMAFNNASFENKWFYAFITSIDYVNNVTSEITFVIDVIQSWLFDYRLEKCFVEREHSATDEIGGNTKEENLETGDFITKILPVEHCPFQAGKYVVVIAQGTNLQKQSDGKYLCVVGNNFTGVDFKQYQDPSAAYDELKKINKDGDSNSVIAVFMIPRIFLDFSESTSGFSSFPTAKTLTIKNGLQNDFTWGFEGYKPKNRKLYTSPYFGLVCKNQGGESKAFGYEFFRDKNNPEFIMEFSLSACPTCTIMPVHYLSAEGDSANLNYKLTFSDFPQCAYATDTFRAWLAQNAGSIALNLAGGALALGAGIATGMGALPVTAIGATGLVTQSTGMAMANATAQTAGSATAMLGQGISGILPTLASIRDHYVAPPTLHGSSMSYMDFAQNRAGFLFYKYSIRGEYAKIIDDFFSVYGYATRDFKVPNTHVRKNWTYTKTSGCAVKGNIPADVATAISSIFDNGITFWTDGNKVGEYGDFTNPVL